MEMEKNEDLLSFREEFDFTEFQERVKISKEDFCVKAFRENRDTIQIKKEKTAVKNLNKIFEATFTICLRKGFQGMSMRDLSQESGLSMGALYSYFRSKEELLNTLQRVGNSFILQVLEEYHDAEKDAATQLNTMIKVHLYLSEIAQQWFFFSYMEAKNLNKAERDVYKESELSTEEMIFNILKKGAEENIFKQRDHQLAASVMKAMIQDWYLKRWKYAKRGISVDRYAEFIIEFVQSFYLSMD